MPSSMALLKTLGKRPLHCYRSSSSLLTLENSLIPLRTVPRREYAASPVCGERGLFRRLFHQRASEQSTPGFPKIFPVPVGEKLREEFRCINITGDRLQLEGITQPQPLITDATASETLAKVSVEDARKLLRVSLIEKLKAKLREIPKNSISYHEFLEICLEACGDETQALELAEVLDLSGNVVVLGSIVFLRPEQLAKSMETVISESMAFPNDPRRKELEDMEKLKAQIDKKAKSQVRGELYCGLGFLAVQTLGFMRLTFWELSWDVMEPICFFVTSLHFASAYGFFLSTSTEPSFEGYFQRRFITKQKKLIKARNFDIQKYNKLRQAFYPNLTNTLPTL
ncbi:putative pentatricopeptide repeat-containing protein [Hibiscus syriacus]|uniref:Pentatricopeptide repeat-containing protein n=1 Tax=Hibiscus syriacus TaxID=106335 RepID=A0A6A2WEP0_HIBSY|nr:calcium uniporter protein 4, mitochondrial-like [Hibiscus syriacus]KAE8656568.1 putative pentatricopeptide repeat-containing protein [Hibiscus syriacus]